MPVMYKTKNSSHPVSARLIISSVWVVNPLVWSFFKPLKYTDFLVVKDKMHIIFIILFLVLFHSLRRMSMIYAATRRRLQGALFRERPLHSRASGGY